jgi:CRP-like cAMP-binding protein
VLHAFARQRLLENLASTSPLFRELSAPVVRAALSGFDLRRLSTSTVVITQGSPGAGLFLVVDGELDVLARGEIGQVRIKRLGAGDVFGEMTLLGGAVTSASVVCATDCTLLALPRPRFSALSGALPELRTRLEALAAERRAHNEKFLPDQTSTAVLG